MALLQPKLNLKVAQRQILTPGLMQMVSVLALNKLELKEMINTEIVENPVLEELDESVMPIDELAGQEAERERGLEETSPATEEKKDPFDEIDFGSYFQEYLDPGFRTPNSFELSEKPSFENFLSQPSTLADHLFWQLGSLNLPPDLRAAAEYVIGNLNEDGYLTSSREEMLEGFVREHTPAPGELKTEESLAEDVHPDSGPASSVRPIRGVHEPHPLQNGNGFRQKAGAPGAVHGSMGAMEASGGSAENGSRAAALLAEAVRLVQGLDPVGIATCDLRECLLVQIDARRREFRLALERAAASPGIAAAHGTELADGEDRFQVYEAAASIVGEHLPLLQKRDLRELAKALSTPPESVQQAIDFIRTLDPRPGQRYNRTEARLIEPDVAFVKREDEFAVVMNEEGLPTLRLNQGYRKLLSQDSSEKEVKDYVKERYRSALQLMRNIEQRKNTILKTCEAIIRRQEDFLEQGVDALKPMMIKEIAEEIGVHPSTVSRAVANKYVHTPQGVFELRFFFSEGVNGPEGGSTPLMLLKRRVKKLIDGEDPRKPLTDDQIATMLQEQGIEVTRRTVAKYREDLRIPSTHQRRVRG